MSDLTVCQFGIGYREVYHFDILGNRDKVDFIELIPENFAIVDTIAKEVRSAHPIALHSVGMSLGSALDPNFLESINRMASELDALWVSDHISFTKAGGFDVGHLVPVPFTNEALGRLSSNILKAMDVLDRPFLVENISYLFSYGSNDMDEAQFIAKLIEETSCHLLLYLENLFNNSRNHKYDAFQFLESIPLDRVMQVHLAGGEEVDGVRIDTHSNLVENQVWDLYRYLAERIKIPYTTIEWDKAFPPFEVLTNQLEYAKRICGDSYGTRRC